jgi:hypothetical protein
MSFLQQSSLKKRFEKHREAWKLLRSPTSRINVERQTLHMNTRLYKTLL